MYVRTENDEIIEIFDDYHHPDVADIVGHLDDYIDLFNKLYWHPKVKPVDGKPSWQLLVGRFNTDGEICIATFDSVKEANEALKSLTNAEKLQQGWDAIEYKEP